MNMEYSIRQIYKRIFMLVIRSFFSVFVPAFVIIFVAIGFVMVNSSNFTTFNQVPMLNRLEGYYTGHGSWEGVKVLFDQSNDTEFIEGTIYLLDAQGKIILDRNENGIDETGLLYKSSIRSIEFNLTANGENIGALVINLDAVSPRVLVIGRILLPVSLFSLFLLFIASTMGLLLSRRIVTPLAEVIAASRAVTDGKLDARVKVQGTQDLLALTEGFNQMADSLERNDRERREMLADIAHELRTPISAIRGRLEGMIDGVYPPDEKHISQTLTATYLLESLVEDLRLLTQAELRQLRFEKKEIDLKDLASQSLDMLSAEAEEKHVQLELKAGPGPFPVLLDSQRTKQVVGNLIENALRYVPEGGRTWITLENEDEKVILSVSDNGPGIPEEELPLIFNRFWRKEKSRSRHSGGSGLGLAIARQFTEAQGGRISAENLPEGGLKIKIIFQKVHYPLTSSSIR
jgi:signal transduction histidine kinase